METSKNKFFESAQKSKKIFDIKKNLERIVLAGTTILDSIKARSKSIINLKKYLRNTTTIAIFVIGAVTITTASISSYKYFQLKQNYNKLSQSSTQTLEENRNLKEEREQFKDKHNQTLEKLTQTTQENTRLLKKNNQSDEKFNQIVEEYQQSEQNRAKVNKKLIQLEKEHNKISQDFDMLAQAYHVVARENEQLKEKTREELEKQTGKLEEKIQREMLSYHSTYGFPGYEIGLLNGQNNWQSSDSIENKGWKVIKKEPPKNAWEQKSYNVLTFTPSSNFETFSPDDNYATFHLYSNKLIKSFIIGGEYNISKNSFLEIFVSGDNKNWTKLGHFESKRKDNFYRVAFGSTPYYTDAPPLSLKLKNDLYVKHSAGAKSNKDYEVEIWSFFASLTTYKNYKEKVNSIHSLSEQRAFLEEIRKE